MIDDHIENDPHGKRLATLPEVVCRFHKINQVLLGAKMRVDVEIVVDVVAVICLWVVLEDRRKPEVVLAMAGLSHVEIAALLGKKAAAIQKSVSRANAAR